MAIENFEEVKQYFETNKENEDVKSYIGGFTTTDRVDTFLNTEDGKKLLQPKLDSYHGKGLETWKTNNLDKLYQERFTKENPLADPKDVELNKMKAMIEKMQSDGNKKDLTNKALKIAEQKKIPSLLVDFFVGIDEETTTKNLEVLESAFSTQVEAIVLERLKGGYKPPMGSKQTTGTTKEDFNKMSYKERIALYDENQELYNEFNK